MRAFLCRGWIALGLSKVEETWIPRLMVSQESSEGDLSSTFISVISPYRGKSSPVRSARLLETAGDADQLVALQIGLEGGLTDTFVSREGTAEPGKKGTKISVPRAGLTTDAEFAFVRSDPSGHPVHVAAYGGATLVFGESRFDLPSGGGLREIVWPRPTSTGPASH